MTDFINPFDFKKILLETLLGSTELGVYALIILISGACAKYNVPPKIYGILLVISALIFAGFLGNAFIVLIILIVGFVTFKSVSRLLT